MVVCTASNCSNSSRIKNMRFFKFPNEEIRRNVWLKKSGLEKEPGAFAKLCEMHFTEDQFEQKRLDGWKKLKPNAVPTLFVQNAKRTTPEAAIAPDNVLSTKSPKGRRRWRKILPATLRPFTCETAACGASEVSPRGASEASPCGASEVTPCEASEASSSEASEASRCGSSDMEESDIIIESVFTVAREEGNGFDPMTETSEVEMVRMNKKWAAIKHKNPVKVKPKRKYKSGVVVMRKLKTTDEVKEYKYNLFSSPLCTNGMQIVDVGEIIKKYVPDASSLSPLKNDSKPEPKENHANGGDIEASQEKIELRELREQHQKEIQELKSMFQNKIEELNAENMKEINKLRARNQKDYETLINEIDELEKHEDEMRRENEAMLEEIQEFIKNNKVMSNVIAELEKHNSKLSSNLSEVKKSLKDMSTLNHHYKIQLSVYLSQEQIDRIQQVQQLNID